MKKFKSDLKHFMAMVGNLPKARSAIGVKSCPVFQNLYARSRLALPGNTTGATIAVAIFGGIGLKVSLSTKVRH